MNTFQEKFVNCSYELDAVKKALEAAESDATLRRAVKALIAATDVISHISDGMSEALAASKTEKAAAQPSPATAAALSEESAVSFTRADANAYYHMVCAMPVRCHMFNFVFAVTPFDIIFTALLG